VTPFRTRKEHELDALSDEELFEYMREARRAGALDAMRTALAVLAFGYRGIVRLRVMLKVPSQDVDEVTDTAIESAIGSRFDNDSIGEFRSWLNRITDRRIADYHRRRENKPELGPLPGEGGDEDALGPEPATEFEGTSVDARRALRQALDELRSDHHRALELYVFAGCSAEETAQEIGGMTEANVHQIASRFRRRLRDLLEAGDTSRVSR
jgi:RNA polymerase sigma factor (sigma-70 family)